MEFGFVRIRNKVGRKGQISVEFIILLLIMLIFIQTIVQPSLAVSLNASEDVSRLGQLRATSEKLVNASDYLHLSPEGSIQTIGIYIPSNSKLQCNANTISFEIELNSPHRECVTQSGITTCQKSLPVIGQLNCSGFGAGQEIATGDSDSYFKIKLRKSNGRVLFELQ